MLRNNSDMPKALKNKMVSGNPRPYSTGILPEDDLLRSKHVGVPLNIFMYFNEINTLD